MTDPEPRRFLQIYLGDHWAGAGAGQRLASRMQRRNRNGVWADDLAWLANQIESDDQRLAELRAALGIDTGKAKRAMAVVVETLSRLKPNGRLTGYSPLSRVVEAEAMMSGVAGKHRLWASMGRADPSGADLSDFDFAGLERRAEEQLEKLRAFHHHAAAIAFGPGHPDPRRP